MTTFFIVVGLIVATILVAMFIHDRREKARGGRLSSEIDAKVRRGHANPEAYRGSTATHPNGYGPGMSGY